MKANDFNSLSVDELWDLRDKIAQTLTSKMVAEQHLLEKRLKQLNRQERADEISKRPTRHYPPVFPKYRNPHHPSETWAGRGKQPRWLVDALKSGKQLDDFRI